MTNKEIAEATRKFNAGELGHWEAARFLSHTLDALEDAHRKLDRVKALWEKWDEEADFAANEMDPRTAETLNRCVQQIGEILLGESTT